MKIGEMCEFCREGKPDAQERLELHEVCSFRFHLQSFTTTQISASPILSVEHRLSRAAQDRPKSGGRPLIDDVRLSLANG